MESGCYLKRIKIAASFLVILTVMFAFLTILPRASAVNIIISGISPTSRHGKVGEAVRLTGMINMTNGLYRIWFDNQKVKEANATKTLVDANFTVPLLPKGNYTITLQDVSRNANASIWFYIDTAYYINAIVPPAPGQLQENSTAKIWVNITGGETNKVYSANVTVKVPAPANETYWKLVTLTNTTNTGNGTAIIVYPTSFNGLAHTNYTGTYTLWFNKTSATNATSTFFVGLTNSTQYHRFQTVNITAVYKPNENVALKITAVTGKNVNHRKNLTADSSGMIHYANWTIPSNASIGTYRVNITSISGLTKKNPPDVQDFLVPGFETNITARNLAGEPVQGVTVLVYENTTLTGNKTSSSAGLAQISLEIGNYTGMAYYRKEKVGERWINITQAIALDFSCNLTNLKVLTVAVVNGVEIPIPEVKVYLTVENTTLNTALNGTAFAHSLLPNRTYVLNSSRYGVLFNTTTISQMPTVAWLNKTIIVPNASLSVYVTDGQNRSISDPLTVRAEELMGGLFYENNTVAGTTVIDCVIGKYTIAVYGKRDNLYVKLNETTVDLFQGKQVPIACKLYGLNVSIRVVDYFGQIIPNANVVMQLADLQYTPSATSGGVATFNNIIGGDLQITVYMPGQSQPSKTTTSYVDSSQVIEIKLEKYVVLAGFLIETSQFATAMIIVVAIVLLLLVEIYRRRRSKPQKSSS